MQHDDDPRKRGHHDNNGRCQCDQRQSDQNPKRTVDLSVTVIVGNADSIRRIQLPGGMAPVPMPDKYIAEMIMDRIAASKVYMGVQQIASDSTEQNSLGLAQMLYEQMKRNYNLE